MNSESEIKNRPSDFLQSDEWFRFQEAAGNEVVRMSDDGLSFGGIIYSLPLAGRYLYTPRFPSARVTSHESRVTKLIDEARRLGCGWVRVEPESVEVLEEIRSVLQNPSLISSFAPTPLSRGRDISPRAGEKGADYSFLSAPHDMQPRETFVVDISKGEAELLAAMKSKTRYNVRLAEKKGVRVFQTTDEQYRQSFIDLVTGTADRKGIVPHPRAYYEAMLTTLLGDTATLFVAEHEGDILGINFMTYHEGTATYLHGGSADVKREYMAPFLLQWEAMKDAKRRRCTRYDFGGVKTGYMMQDTGYRMTNGELQETRDTSQLAEDKEWKDGSKNHASSDWAGITRFKVGFSPETAPTVFPGCYDIILSPSRYFLYTFFSALRSQVVRMRKMMSI